MTYKIQTRITWWYQSGGNSLLSSWKAEKYSRLMNIWYLWVEIDYLNQYNWCIELQDTYLLYIFFEIMLWNQPNLREISSHFERKYLQIHDTFVWTYIYLNWSSWSEEIDSFIEKSEKCLIKVSLKVHRFHFSFFPRTGEKVSKGLIYFLFPSFYTNFILK